jgi:hypothetical protein
MTMLEGRTMARKGDMNRPTSPCRSVDPYVECRDIWKDYNSRQEFEHDLINRKTTWLLTTESILFAAFGLTFRAVADTTAVDAFRYIVAASGLLSALAIWRGVRCLITSKHLSWEQYRDFYAKSANIELPRPLQGEPLPWGVDNNNTRRSLAPDQFQPAIFALAWVVLMVWTAFD